MPQIKLCFGIDPQPAQHSFSSFQEALVRHCEVIDVSRGVSTLKPNLAFFMRYGSRGIAELEGFCEKYRNKFDIIIDGKFNEIANSLNAYLDFVFNNLGATGITINAFLGEKTIEQTLHKAVSCAGTRARVYVLCATSEVSDSHLSYLQSSPQKIIESCIQVSERFDNLPPKALGLVVGANRENVILSQELLNSHLSVLSPGLGAQGASYDVLNKLKNMKTNCEFTFPMSRGIFQGGENSVTNCSRILFDVQECFK